MPNHWDNQRLWTLVLSSAVLLLAWVLKFNSFVAVVMVLAIRLIFYLSRQRSDDGPVNGRGKLVFITGCDSGFGHSLAERLAALNFRVIAGCLQPEGEGATGLKNGSDNIDIIKCDVTKSDDIDNVEGVIRTIMTDEDYILWSVVNNAGIAVYSEPEWTPMDWYERCININSLGPVRVTKALLPLIRQSHGRVINVASLAGRVAMPDYTAYSMSKYAAVSFSESLRRSMHKFNVKVITIEPPLYRTPIVAENLHERNIRKFWDDLPDNTRKDYGESYFNAYIEHMKKMLRMARPNPEEVVDSMVQAVTERNPRNRYVPGTWIKDLILRHLPMDVADVIFRKTAVDHPVSAP